MIWLYGLGIGGSAGLLGSLLGIGGGIVMVPLLNKWLGQDMHTAKNSSLAIIAIIGVAGTISASRYQPLDWRIIGACGLFAIIAAPFGVWLSHKLSTLWLTRLLAVFLIFVGVKYLVDSFKPAPAAIEPTPDYQSAPSALPGSAPVLDDPTAPDHP